MEEPEVHTPRLPHQKRYCSVFHECWTVHDRFNDDKPVKECRRDETTEFMP